MNRPKLLAFALIAATGIAGCDGEQVNDTLPTDPPTDSPPDNYERPLAEFIGRYSPETGLTFEPVEIHGRGNLPGYTQLTTGAVTLATPEAVLGPATFNSGDTCLASQLCAVVQITNNSINPTTQQAGRAIDKVRAEVSQVVGATPTQTDSLDPLVYPTTANPTYGWSYGDLNVGDSPTAVWRFNLSASTVEFKVTVWGSYRRTTYSSSSGTVTNNDASGTQAWADSSPAWRDACVWASPLFTAPAGSGASSVTTATVAPPIPMTVYSTHRDSTTSTLRISSVGTVGGTAGSISETNASIATGSNVSPPVNTFYVFWDALRSGTVCAAVDPSSTAPRRRYVVTWKNMQLRSDLVAQAIDSNWIPATMTFSFVYQEGTDRVWYLYHDWTAFDPALGDSGECYSYYNDDSPQGLSASFGVRASGSGQKLGLSYNTKYLPDKETCGGAGDGYFVSLSPL